MDIWTKELADMSEELMNDPMAVVRSLNDARNLCTAGLGEGTSKGMLTVGAYEENAHARAFYRRGGFEEIGSREDELTGSREYWTEWKGESI